MNILERIKQSRLEKEEAAKKFGASRSSGRFANPTPILEKDGWVLEHFGSPSKQVSNYIVYNLEDVLQANGKHIPVVEFQCEDHTLEFKGFISGTRQESIPLEVAELINSFLLNFKTTDTKPVPVRYLKMYIAVLDEVPDHMVPTLVAHSVLGNHLWISAIDQDITSDCQTIVERRGDYHQWLAESFRKCVVRVDRKAFEKIKKLRLVYLGHENRTLGGEKSCAIPYPMWNDEVPNVLKFAKLWEPVK